MNAIKIENLYKANTYRNKPKEFALEAISKVQNYFFNKNVNYKNQLDQYEKLLNAITTGLSVDFPEGLKNQRQDLQITKLYEMLAASNLFNIALEETVLPFLKEANNNCSFTLTVGPGEDYNQMYPHDAEFHSAVFDTYPRNAVFIFEGGGEAEFADNYTEMFNVDEIAIPFNKWASGFLDDLAKEFNVQKGSIGIEKRNDYTIVLRVNTSKAENLFVLYKGDYVRSIAEDSLRKIVAITKKNILICGIRHGDCADIFLRDSQLFYDHFDFYVFTHGNIPQKNLKSRDTSFRFNLKHMRRNMEKNNAYNNLTQNIKGREAMAYGTSKLCTKNINKPYCVQGVKNESIFWEGLGGKTRKQRNRKRKQTKRFRKH